ncbi:ester cyclase [Streptomyces sp. A1136]|uniref:ester cyclase n=1 Tax=Streptomyces sp. A1136 TaxID=2563102 RepID=UPI00109E3AB5|nr:ester cyclase [Streptomyces sp. A1136]THA57871.1 ester cyclase [Streptomyces sp. A1136]
MDDNEEAIRNFFEAVSERRLADLPEFMAHDVVDHNKIIHGEADEPSAAFEGLRRQLAAFDPLTIHVEEVIAASDKVVARLTQRGVNGGAHPRMPEPTGRPFENEAIWILTVRDGKIAEIRAVSDRLGLFLQLGWDWPQVD